DMALADRWHRADRVDAGDERERTTEEVVDAPRADEADVGLRDARLGDRLMDHRHDDLDLVVLGVLRDRAGRVRDDRDISRGRHQRYSLYVSNAASGSPIGSQWRIDVWSALSSSAHFALTRMPMRTSWISQPRIRPKKVLFAPSSRMCAL